MNLLKCRYVIWICFFIVICSTTIFPTDLCGLTSGTLTVAGSPYIVTCNVDVPDGATLTIEPGVEIRFDEAWIFEVHGTLIAQGSAGNNILFTINDISTGNWRQIYFNESENSILDYCVIEYAGSGTSNTAGINLYRSDPLISNTTVKETSSRGIYLRESSPTITNCTIASNVGIGIEAVDIDSGPFIQNTLISDNLHYAISMFGRNIKHIGNVTITGNLNNSIRIQGDNIDDGDWFNHNVPYVINGNLTVNDGSILTIDPGTELKFNGDYVFEVNGALVAIGEENNRIIFTSNEPVPSPGDWRQLYFSDCDSATILDYCTVRYGGSTGGAMINISSSYSFVIRDTEMDSSLTDGIRISNSSPSISSCYLTGNGGIGINVTDAGSDPSIAYNEIYYNGDYAISSYADNIKRIYGNIILGNNKNSIRVEGETVSSAIWVNPTTIIAEAWYVIVGNISVADGETLTIKPGAQLRFNGDYIFEVNGALIADGLKYSHIIFTSNKVTPAPGDWRHLSFQLSDPGTELNYCEILYAGSNTTALNLTFSNFPITNTVIKNSLQRGIYLNQSSPTIRGCTISENLDIGVQIVSGLPDLGTIKDPGNNTFLLNAGWDVYNNTPDTIYAQENFWGDIDSAAIDGNHIYDDDENPSKGIVIFQPFLKSPPTDVEEIIETEIPTEFRLEQNYPNPFNPTTNIGFRIADFGMVTLKVFDVLGNEVAILFDEYRPAGNYEIEFDASKLTSGIYFYQLIAGSFTETKKMILMK